LRAAFSTNVRVVGTARKVDITDCSGVTFFIDKVVREVRALRCHLCKFVVGWHMPFFSLESCSDSIIVSNIADDAGQIIETAKCSGINLRCVVLSPPNQHHSESGSLLPHSSPLFLIPRPLGGGRGSPPFVLLQSSGTDSCVKSSLKNPRQASHHMQFVGPEPRKSRLSGFNSKTKS
jgi:hypothetical protein